MEYSRRTPNYFDKIALFDSTHMTSITNLITMDVETLRIDRGVIWRKSSLI